MPRLAELGVLLEQLHEFGYRFGGLVELGDELVERLVGQDEVLVLLDHPLGPGGDGVEHERGDRGVLEVRGLTDERVLVRGDAHLQAVASGRGCRGVAHAARISPVRTLSGRSCQQFVNMTRTHGVPRAPTGRDGPSSDMASDMLS